MIHQLLILTSLLSITLSFSPSVLEKSSTPISNTALSMSSTCNVNSSPIGVGINGFGRIGRLVTRVLTQDPNIQLQTINAGSATPEYMAYQYKYDTVHGVSKDTVEVEGNYLVINGQKILTSRCRNPKDVPWGNLGAEYVCESTGKFLTQDLSKGILESGAKKVIFSAPAKDDSLTIVMGVNENSYNKVTKSQHNSISCASCTTNGLAPIVKVLQDKYGIEEALMTTVHAMTSTQAVVDSSSKKDWRGGRSASGNIIPSSTGAAKAVTKVIPELQGKLTGMAFRVPTLDVSVVDLTCKLRKETTYEDICAKMKESSEKSMNGILGYSDEDLVSSDYISDPRSSIFDKRAGIMLNPTFVKVVAWYDNEWGYSNRVVDLIKHVENVDSGR